MTGENMLAVGGFVVTAGGVLVNALWLMRRVTQSESEIKHSIAQLGKETTAKIDTHNMVAGMRFDELGRRVGGVEGTLSKITKVVVFPEGRET